MPEEKRKIPRLGKAATEFNVSIGAITEFLKKKNFDIEENPNTKLTEEMYDILLHEPKFAKEKQVKAEANKIDIGTFSAKAKADTKTEVKAAAKAEEPEEVSDDNPLIIKNTGFINPPQHIETEVPTVKVVGKIDLSEGKSHKKSKEAKEEATAQNADVPESTSEQPVVTETPETTPEATEPKAPKVPEHIETVVTTLEQPKVIDKIDLSTLERKKKSGKGKNAVPAVESAPEEAPVQAEEEPVGETTNIAPDASALRGEPDHKVEFIETRVEKIQGPKIMGKIELPVERPKDSNKKDNRGGNNADADKKKKKRKRIIKQAGVKASGGKDDRNAKAEPEKVEISPEDIQRRIKETKQRLEPAGKTKASKRRKEKRQLIHERIEEQELQELENQKILKVTEFLTANELATMMNKPVNDIIATCMSIGLFVSINQRLDAETISLLAEEFGFQVEFIGADAEDGDNANDADAPEDLQPRHPIITVMGHVDHGKTSLLDYIRKTNVIAGEAGGITQHIGAYLVQLSDGRKITFLDTPGHEAFTAMRARGARITDLCIIVIAADDAVMPQTVEAINHAQAAGVPMVFAITKIDKPNADVDRIKSELANMNILVEDWGGKYQCQEIDAKHGTNVQELLEKVLLEADLLDLKANPNRPGVGAVIESALDKGRGYIAKVLVQNGTLSVGDPILAGSCFGKVKAMFNERNQAVKSAGPATPVLLLGLNGAPQAGDSFKVCETEQEARSVATKRARLAREMGLRTQKHITLDEIGRRIAIGDFKELNIIVKGDVDGSVEALSGELLKLSTEQVQVNVIHKSVGAVTETDVMLATASNALIVAFQVRPTAGARRTAEAEQIDIRTYSIIYQAINEIKDAIAGMHSPEIREKVVANIEIREVFHISKVGNVAGCMVLDGKLQRSTKIRLIRDGIVIYTGKLGSLRRFKDDVKEVVSGQDCGLNIDGCNDIKIGDIIEGYEEYEVAYNPNK
ncbi:MAG: translation initiation factor IF-2 [Bacteroidales bacterium]|nr:translation initiation factor IF-2 [Bacteroidales bacterium]